MIKNKVTFVLPVDLHMEMRQKIISDGYGLRGKSLWVCEAIEQLFSINNYPEFVDINDEMRGFEKSETIVVTTSFKLRLDASSIEVRRFFPAMNGVQSRIIRTAILQRLLRS